MFTFIIFGWINYNQHVFTHTLMDCVHWHQGIICGILRDCSDSFVMVIGDQMVLRYVFAPSVLTLQTVTVALSEVKMFATFSLGYNHALPTSTYSSWTNSAICTVSNCRPSGSLMDKEIAAHVGHNVSGGESILSVVCVCSNANPLHYYVLRVPRKVDRWHWVWSIFESRTACADHITCGVSICIVYGRKLRLGWLYVWLFV